MRETRWWSVLGSWPAAILVVLLVSVSGLFATFAMAQAEPGPSVVKPEGSESAPQPTEAEQIVGLRTLLDSDWAWRASLASDLVRIAAEYDKASGEFAALDQRLQALGLPPVNGEPPVGAVAVATLTAERDAARDRFDLLIQRRKAIRQQLATLDEKIALESEILEDLVSGRIPTLETAPATPTPPGVQPPVAAESAPSMVPGLPMLPRLSGVTRATDSAPNEQTDERVTDAYVAEARADLAKREADLSAAAAGLKLVDRAIVVFTRDLESARQVRVAAEAELKVATEGLRLAIAAKTGGPAAEEEPGTAAGLEAAVISARAQVEEARAKLVRHAERVDGSETTMVALRRARDQAAAAVDAAQTAAESSTRSLAFVKSPFAPHRLRQWVVERAPRIAIVVAAFVGIWLLARLLARRVLSVLVRRGKRGSEASRQERAETLRRVIESAVAVLLFALGALAILGQAGMDVTVLLGGTAVIGAAIALGSQNLVKGYLSGLTVLLENQYSVGNVIRLGSTSGVVEDITLRMTVLRDLEGIVHFVPHSHEGSVSNMTYGWSRALFDIGVSYNEDVNKVMQVLMDLSLELRNDETFGPYMLGEPEMLGVDSFGESAVMIKFFIKTRPLRQWLVKREMNRRIKLRFDELGIEIPFPHRTVYHRGLEGLRGDGQEKGNV